MKIEEPTVKRPLVSYLLILLFLALAGCRSLPAIQPTAAEVVDIEITVQPELQPTSPEPSVTATPLSPTPDSYPMPQAYPGPGLAYPQPGIPYLPPEAGGLPTIEPYVFQTSTPGTVTLQGVLAVTDPMVLMPASDDAIYLVALSGGKGAPSTIPPIEKGKTPQADVDERTGEFRFTNIKPGQYAVVVVTLGGSEVPARDYESGNFAIITVTEADLNQIIDLGALML
jgi:hypothetical protein